MLQAPAFAIALAASAATAEQSPISKDAQSSASLPNETQSAPENSFKPTQNDSGEIVVEAKSPYDRTDPLQSVNAASFAATQAVDTAVMGPLATGYKHVVPGPIRSGIRNALSNLHQPVVSVSFLLEGKVGKAAETAGRFAINSTVGVVGVFDVARKSPFDLPNRPNGFADVFGFYGVRSGAYLYLPLIGPTTVRDLVGGALDRAVLPLSVGRPFNKVSYTVPTGTLSALDRRAEFERQLSQIRSSDNPYSARRALYLRNRQSEIDGLHSHRNRSAEQKSSAEGRSS